MRSLVTKLFMSATLALSLGAGMIPLTAHAAPANTATANALLAKLGPVARQHVTAIGPKYIYCTPEWIYDSVSNQGRNQISFGPTYGDYNGTPYNATMTLIATVGGTATVTWSAGATLDASVVLAGVQASVNGSVSLSLTATVTNNFQITVPPYKTGYGNYGVWRQVAYGHYYYLTQRCGVGTDYGWRTTYSPWYVGWNTWIG